MQEIFLRLEKFCNKGRSHRILLLFICSLAVTLPAFVLGFRGNSDLIVHLTFAQAIQDAAFNGDLFPGWANDNFGFGSIGIRFYPPITFYATAIAETLTGSWYFAIWINLLAWMFLGCLGMYLFVKEWGTPVQGIIGGFLYAAVPFHLAEIYRVFLYAEFAAGAMLPFCFLYVTRICKRGRWIDCFLFAIFYSLLLLTHLPLAVIATFSLAVYTIFQIEWRNLGRSALLLLVSGVIAAAAAGFYCIRLLAELQWLAHAYPKYAVKTDTLFHYLFPSVFFNSHQVSAPFFRQMDIMVVLTMMLLIPSAVILINRKKLADFSARSVVFGASATAVFACLLLSRFSEFFWTRFVLLQKIQYPWRWLSVLSMLAVASCSLSLLHAAKATRTFERLAVYGAVFAIVLMVAYDARQAVASGVRLPKAEFYDLIENKMPTWTIQDQWWTAWATKKAFDQKEPVIAAGRSVEIRDWQSERRTFIVGEGPATNLRIATFYYPYWRATANGATVEVDKDESGVIILPIGAERSEIDLRFEEPLSHILANWLSAATWLILLGVAGYRILAFSGWSRSRSRRLVRSNPGNAIIRES